MAKDIYKTDIRNIEKPEITKYHTPDAPPTTKDNLNPGQTLPEIQKKFNDDAPIVLDREITPVTNERTLADDQDTLNNVVLGDAVHSWDKDAQTDAGTMLSADEAAARQAALASRRNIEKNAGQAALEDALLGYKKNQTVDRMGWTGGSLTDANTQMDYLRMSIAADMYGQMELQAMGFHTELAKARAAYDMNMRDLALKYEQVARERAVQDAQLTGLWVSPEIRDTVNQYQLAQSVLSDPNASETERQRAEQLTETVLSWFSNRDGTPLSPQGVNALIEVINMPRPTLTAIQIEQLELSNVMDRQAIDITAQQLAEKEANRVNVSTTNVRINTGDGVLNINPNTTDPEQMTQLREHFATNTNDLNALFKAHLDKAHTEFDLWKSSSGSNKNASFKEYFEGTTGREIRETLDRLAQNYSPEDYTYTHPTTGWQVSRSGQKAPEAAPFVSSTGETIDPSKVISVSGWTSSNTDEFREMIGSYADGKREGSNQVAYADAILKAINNGKVLEGQIIFFNYGIDFSVDISNHVFVYTQGKLVRFNTLYPDKERPQGNEKKEQYFIPEGYKIGWSGNIVKN
jgi:hypothetical protein